MCRPESGDTEHRKVWPSRQNSAEGMVGRLGTAERPNTEPGRPLNLNGERDPGNSMAEIPKSAPRSTRPNPRRSTKYPEDVMRNFVVQVLMIYLLMIAGLGFGQESGESQNNLALQLRGGFGPVSESDLVGNWFKSPADLLELSDGGKYQLYEPSLVDGPSKSEDGQWHLVTVVFTANGMRMADQFVVLVVSEGYFRALYVQEMRLCEWRSFPTACFQKWSE